MLTTILGNKNSQEQAYTPEGKRIVVTRLTVGPCYITSVSDAPNGRQVQLGFGKLHHPNKAILGHLKKAGLEDKKLHHFHSTTIDASDETIKLGQEIRVENLFQVKDTVTIVGTSKGKGFAGVVKRHNFKGGPRTHGQSDRERSPGSIGQTTTPGRVYRGKRMAGRMGGERVTVHGLQVVDIDPKTNSMTVRGLVPGGTNGLLVITKE